jgi:DNA-binding PadR family transcriptional regulator
MIGRHRGRRGFGGLGGGGFGAGFGGFTAGRKLGSGDLHLVILTLLAEQPRHGYDIIKALEERSKGFYAPSPGMVYPALTYLEELGHAVVTAEGAKKLYTITAEGRAHLAANQVEANAIMDQLAAIGRKLEQVREFFSGEEESGDALHAARHDLRHILREKRHADPAERKRVAEILLRAIAEIREN